MKPYVEACERNRGPILDALRVEPLLISTDSPERNLEFRAKLSIPWPLLSDARHEVADLMAEVSRELGLLLGRIRAACGTRICLETFPTRVGRGAGSAVLESARAGQGPH